MYITLSGCWCGVVLTLSGLVLVLEDSDPLVLEDDLVVVWVGDRRIKAHVERMTAGAIDCLLHHAIRQIR